MLRIELESVWFFAKPMVWINYPCGKQAPKKL